MRTRTLMTVALAAASILPLHAADEEDPIACWWRTSASAVRAGQPFTLVLTCAVVENALVTIVPDESRLDPSVMQLAPFDVIGGRHGTDLRADDRRFFQYEYTL